MQEQQNPCSQKKSKPCGAEQTDEMPCCGFSNAAPECTFHSESENDESCKRNQCPMPDFDCSKFINEKCGAPDSVSKAVETEENEQSPLPGPLETDENEQTKVSKTSEETEPTEEEGNKRASTASKRGSNASNP